MFHKTNWEVGNWVGLDEIEVGLIVGFEFVLTNLIEGFILFTLFVVGCFVWTTDLAVEWADGRAVNEDVVFRNHKNDD
jgi:hypothetical protein